MTITEDYVSFEVAKLLKEKGFDQNCATYYLDGQVWRHYHCEVIPKGKQIYAAPTQAMAMKWLREVHNLHIDIDPSEGDWNPTVLELENWSCVVKFGDEIPIQDSYEEACEAAIKYCLENLI